MVASTSVHRATDGLYGGWGRCSAILGSPSRSLAEKTEAADELRGILGTLIMLGREADIPRSLLIKLGMIPDENL